MCQNVSVRVIAQRKVKGKICTQQRFRDNEKTVKYKMQRNCYPYLLKGYNIKEFMTKLLHLVASVKVNI
jgi:hypothetical protein